MLHQVIGGDPVIRGSPRITAKRLPHLADGRDGPRFGLARPGVRSSSSIVNDLQHQYDGVAALMLRSCSTTAAARPPERANGVRLAIGSAALLLSGCRTWRKACPHSTAGVAAPHGRTCRTWRAVLQHQRDGPAARPSVPAAGSLRSCRTDCAIGTVHAHDLRYDWYDGYDGYDGRQVGPAILGADDLRWAAGRRTFRTRSTSSTRSTSLPHPTHLRHPNDLSGATGTTGTTGDRWARQLLGPTISGTTGTTDTTGETGARNTWRRQISITTQRRRRKRTPQRRPRRVAASTAPRWVGSTCSGSE
jgi:hypothetical protein